MGVTSPRLKGPGQSRMQTTGGHQTFSDKCCLQKRGEEPKCCKTGKQTSVLQLQISGKGLGPALLRYYRVPESTPRTSMTLLKELHPHTPQRVYTPAGVFYTPTTISTTNPCKPFTPAAFLPFALICVSSRARGIHFIGDLPKSYTTHKSPRNFF